MAYLIKKTALFAGLCVLGAWNIAMSADAELNITGFAGIESRYFVNDAVAQGSSDNMQNSAVLEWGLSYELQDNYFSLLLNGRADSKDAQRSHFDIREAYWQRGFGDVEVLAGINTVFWGVTESNHLINIINTPDALVNLDGEDFLGQPMLNVNWNKSFGTFALYLLPEHRQTYFASTDARLALPLPVTATAQYLGSAKASYLSSALRYSHYLDNWDFGAYYFHGVSREAAMNVNVTPLNTPAGVQFVPTSLTPSYALIDQIGVDVQLTTEAWLWKFEGVHNKNNWTKDSYNAAVGGFEYSFYQLMNSDKDLGVLVEYSYNERGGDVQNNGVLLDDDLFLGARLAWNDTQDTSLLVGLIADVNDGSQSVRVEGERRLGDIWSLGVEGQFFTNIDEKNVLNSLKDNDFIALSLNAYF